MTFEYLNGIISRSTNRDSMIGYLMAYEFQSKDFSLIVERKDAEKKSLSTIRNDFQKKLAEAENEVSEYISKSNLKFEQYAKQIDMLKSGKETEYANWFDQTLASYNHFFSESTEKVKGLENTYQEKLKLEAPAQYWNKRAKKLRSEGKNWLIGLILSVGVAVGILIWVLNEIASGTLENVFQNTGTAIKWSVVIITLISFLAFMIRTFSKLTFSSFHLVRDAEEREQLAYVYLALKKEETIDKTERHLIMQSLFSRADSGLLKDDASPTMPGNIIDRALTK